MRHTRTAVTLVEVLLAVAVLAVLIGLLIPAVQKVRESASRTHSLNNLRQTALGMHQVASARDGYIGGIRYPNPQNRADIQRIEQDPLPIDNPLVLIVLQVEPTAITTMAPTLVKFLLGPADPTLDGNYPLAHFPAEDGHGELTFYSGGAPVSYGFNMVAFTGTPRLTHSFPDGTANTIAFCGRYYRLCYSPDPIMVDPNGVAHYRSTRLQYAEVGAMGFGPPPTFARQDTGPRRPSFADAGWGDVVPVTDPATKVTRPSRPGATFQVKPTPPSADPHMPQTPFSAGLPVAMFDGSVRTIRPGVSPEAFWAAVTPAGGETAPLD